MKRRSWLAAPIILALAILACTLAPPPTAIPGIEETRVALGVQQTSMANQQMTLSALLQPTALLPSAATYTPYPTYTPVPPEGIVASPSAVPLDMEELIKRSNILIYEDIAGDPELVPIVISTINAMNFSGGKIVNTSDRLGDFKEQATSSTAWDLIIVAAEVRSSFSGEMFEMMYDHIDNGGAVIIEAWYLDKVGTGKIAPILNQCGVRIFRNWTRDYGYDPFKYSITWLDSSHPLLASPNTALAPAYPYPEWFDDAGDLLELGPGGDAVLVGGLYPNRTSDYGVLASCLDGRMVLQTFSSHDYKWTVMQPLWENYITYTLTRHYEQMP